LIVAVSASAVAWLAVWYRSAVPWHRPGLVIWELAAGQAGRDGVFCFVLAVPVAGGQRGQLKGAGDPGCAVAP
jgi:hypothetical protein